MKYKTISKLSTGEFKDRGSKFIAYAFAAYNEKEWQGHLEFVKKEHFKARHHCYGFRLGLDKNNFRANDDGEPSGTAGKPILGQIDSFGLTNIIIIVVRYFGGTKLGTSGLINAYRESARIALQNADIIDKTLDEIYRLTFEYALMSEVMGTIKKLELEIILQDFGNIGIIEISIPKNKVKEKIDLLRAGIAKVRLEELEKVEKIEGLELELLGER